MKLEVKDKDNVKISTVDLPIQFSESIREDIIKRAVEAFWKNNRQAYGAKPGAGQRASADLSRRRHKYRGSYGFGISRVPRKIISRRGTRMNWVGAVAPGTVSGRRAHPPKADKIQSVKINKKERRKAIRSAMAATLIPELVMARGHIIPDDYPFAISSKIEEFKTTKSIVSMLDKFGFTDELNRAKVKKIRPGKGKSRGRKYKKKTSILVVVSENCALQKCSNIPGVDFVQVDKLNMNYLAPGTVPGRITLWTDGALKKLHDNKLYI